MLLIGQIKAFTAKTVWILSFDATGRLDAETSWMPISDLTQVTFASEYINVWSKYLKPPVRKATASKLNRKKGTR
jgi:hypothetical protein